MICVIIAEACFALQSQLVSFQSKCPLRPQAEGISNFHRASTLWVYSHPDSALIENSGVQKALKCYL